VLAANTLLDWLGPVAAAINNAATLAVRTHSPDEVQRWLAAANAQAPRRQQLEPFAQLQPLDPPPPPDAVAQEVMARLGSGGAYLPFSRLPAAASVTSLAKQHGVGGDGAVAEAALELPRFLAQQQQALAPTERGQATHLVLEHFDFRRGDQLDPQIEQMVIRRLLTEAQAQAVDRDTIRWLLDSPLGLKLRQQSDHLRREMAFNYALPARELGGPASSEPMDQVMLRGRVDLLLGGRDGWEVVDYKTDHVSGQRLADRVEQYRGQMQFYCRAIEGIVRQRVLAMHLVFLHARQVVSFAWEPENSAPRP
jgi:ATP-dependent helicase/nuclease subunit A